MPFRRFCRWLTYRCLVCGRSVGSRVPNVVEGKVPHYRYCSMECGMYDGVMAARADVKVRKSWIFYGRLKEPKRHYEAAMDDE